MAETKPKRLTDQQVREIAALLRPHLDTLRAVRAARLAREKAAAA